MGARSRSDYLLGGSRAFHNNNKNATDQQAILVLATQLCLNAACKAIHTSGVRALLTLPGTSAHCWYNVFFISTSYTKHVQARDDVYAKACTLRIILDIWPELLK